MSPYKRRFLRSQTALLLFVLSVAGQTWAAEVLAVLNAKLLPEASGIAVSGRSDTRLWLINDSKNRPDLVALDYDQDRHSTVRLKGVSNNDWEDLASFTYQGEPWLAVADTGDNDADRRRVYVYLFPEPMDGEREVVIRTRIAISYPDGPRDVESIAIDSERQILYLLSKRDQYPRLYSVLLPELHTTAQLERVAQKLGEVTSIPPPSRILLKLLPKYGKYASQPTAMAIMPGGDSIAIMTYGSAYLATLNSDRNWLQSLNESLCRVTTPNMQQAESIATDALGRLYVTSEGKERPLYRIPGRCST